MLNAAGYGCEGSGLDLDLVYNPNGAFLAPAQAALEEAYRSVRLRSCGPHRAAAQPHYADNGLGLRSRWVLVAC